MEWRGMSALGSAGNYTSLDRSHNHFIIIPLTNKTSMSSSEKWEGWTLGPLRSLPAPAFQSIRDLFWVNSFWGVPDWQCKKNSGARRNIFSRFLQKEEENGLSFQHHFNSIRPVMWAWWMEDPGYMLGKWMLPSCSEGAKFSVMKPSASERK